MSVHVRYYVLLKVLVMDIGREGEKERGREGEGEREREREGWSSNACLINC